MAVGGEEAVVALVVVEGEPQAGGAAGLELVRQQLGRLPPRDADLLQRIRGEEPEVLPQLVPRRQRAAGGRAVEAREHQLAAVEIDGPRPGRVPDVGVEIAELEELPHAGDLQRERRGVAVPEQVVLRQLRLAEEALAAGEAEADLEGAGQLLLDRHLEDHLVVARSAPAVDLDVVEEPQRRHALLGDAHGRAVVEIPLVDAHLAADDLVARLVVADQLDLLDGDQVALLEHVGQIDGLLLRVDGRVGGDVGVGIALVLVDVEQPLHVGLQARLGEALPWAGDDEREQLLARHQQIPGHVDLADVVGLALVDGHGDVDEPLVGRQLDGRLAELHVDVADVEVHPLEDDLVALEGLLAVGAGAGEEAEEGALGGEHGRLELFGGEGLVADEADLPHGHLGVLVDDEDDVDLVVGQRADGRRDLGEEVALLDVLLLHLLGRLAHRLHVEDLELLDLDGVLEVVLGQLFVALELDLADGGLLVDDDGQRVAGERRRRMRDVELDVAEVAHLPHGEEGVLQLRLVVRVAGLEGEDGLDGVGLHATVALDLDLRDRARVGNGHAGLRRHRLLLLLRARRGGQQG